MQCHNTAGGPLAAGSIALVGHPNVGKSVVFKYLTGLHVTVSNYPGTTVEVTRGAVKAFPELTLVDTPGVVTFPPHSEDEQVTARVLFDGALKAILQVGDAKNLRRTLLLTVQLAEMGLPVALALNMMDEAKSRGVLIDHARLAALLQLPVIPTIAVRGQGIQALLESIQTAGANPVQISYPPIIQSTVNDLVEQLEQSRLDLPISARSLALLFLAGDQVCEQWLTNRLSQPVWQQLLEQRSTAQAASQQPLAAAIAAARSEYLNPILAAVLVQPGSGRLGLASRLSQLTTHPVWGWLMLAGVLYGLYWFVGIFGAGTLVGLLEENLFGQVLNPWLTGWVTRLSPAAWLTDMIVGEYGVWTMGMTYALALILPIVTTFFLAFGVLEDSGYLPRLAALSNRLFVALGLNGKAVLPMVLGLGCVTMATLTTRVLESKRERLLVTLLLALGVPCSAQLGVVMGMLAGISLTATLIWISVVVLIMLAVGWLAARVTPGERTALLVELPPLRLPQASNVVLKTLARLEWYTKEVIPLFLVGALLMFTLNQLGLLETLIRLGEPLVVKWLGLPREATAAFLMGFLRRDFGATGLFSMQTAGLLSPLQVVVAMVTITLFIPCIASVMMIAKERDWQTAAGMFVFIMPLAIVVGGLLNRVLLLVGWGL